MDFSAPSDAESVAPAATTLEEADAAGCGNAEEMSACLDAYSDAKTTTTTAEAMGKRNTNSEEEEEETMSTFKDTDSESPKHRLDSDRSYACFLRAVGTVDNMRGYALGAIKGRGTYGVVFTARDMYTGAMVALKQVVGSPSAAVARMDARAAARISATSALSKRVNHTAFREHAILSACSHPNIVKLFGVVLETNRHEGGVDTIEGIYLSLELCAGSMATVCFAALPRPVGLLKHLTMGLLEALEYLHEKGIVHRDIKLENVLVAPDGTTKLADFGLARGRVSSKHKGANVVSALYRPPELFLGDQAYGTEVDIWPAAMAIGELFAWRRLENIADKNGSCFARVFALCGKPAVEDVERFKTYPFGSSVEGYDFGAAHEGQMFGFVARGMKYAYGVEVTGVLPLLRACLVYNPAQRPTAAACKRALLFSATPENFTEREAAVFMRSAGF